MRPRVDALIARERVQPPAGNDVWRPMRVAIGAFRLLATTTCLTACTPRWTKPEFREEATELAIELAMNEHACPRDQISVRCDASSTTRILDGRMVVYDEDSVIGTYVTETPEWEVELAVCGHLRRYRYEPPDPGEVVDDTFWMRRKRHGMSEVRRSCAGAYCLGAEPACTNCGRDHWWPVDTMPTSSLCNDAIDDGSVNVEVVDEAVELVLVVDQPREIPRRCGESPLFVVIDDVWYSLCGDGVARFRPGVYRVPTGITLGVNMHGGRTHVVRAFDARASNTDRCRGSTPLQVVLPRTKVNWVDILTVSGRDEPDAIP